MSSEYTRSLKGDGRSSSLLLVRAQHAAKDAVEESLNSEKGKHTMPRATRSIFIKGNPDQVFELTNDIPRWTELYTNMAQAKVLSFEREGRFAKIVFELTNKEGHTWRAWRILDFQDCVAMSRRDAPSFPYAFHHLTWRYEPAEGGTLMTWTDDFEMDPEAPIKNEVALQPMLAHMAEAQENFKKVIEAYLASSAL